LLIKVQFANIINIINNSEIIPELLQSDCNAQNIYKHVESFITNPEIGRAQVSNYQKILKKIKINISSAEKVSNILNESIN
jgi:lipid-A-disaccharide synthase